MAKAFGLSKLQDYISGYINLDPHGKLAERHTQAMLRVLKDHNAKEEQILYPACDQLLSPDETKRVMDEVQKSIS